jgi:hypothetical protein
MVISRKESEISQLAMLSDKEATEKYFQHFSEVIGSIRDATGGYDGWWVYGGNAWDAILDRQPEVRRQDGSFRDIDILFSVPLQGIGAREKRRNTSPVSIGTSFLHRFAQIDLFGESKLVHGKLVLPVPNEVFKPRLAEQHGVLFPMLQPETLFHLQIDNRREKDYRNMFELGIYLHDNPNPNYPEELYKPFHEFADAFATQDGGISGRLYKMVERYTKSRVNHYLPIDNPTVRRPLELGWRTVGKFERVLFKK